MDLNLVVLAGRLASPPEVRVFESGSRLVRYLVTVRSEEPNRRVDVVPVSLWDPDDALIDADPAPGQAIFVVGATQRRFWSGEDGRRSRLEVVASAVLLREPTPEEVVAYVSSQLIINRLNAPNESHTCPRCGMIDLPSSTSRHANLGEICVAK